MRKFMGLAPTMAAVLLVSGTSRAEESSNTATIEVSVPADARVWFDDFLTEQTGFERSFESPPLKPGKAYSYVVTAQWRGPNGNDVVRKERVRIRANEKSTLEFAPRALLRTAYYEFSPVYTPNDYYQPGYYGGGRGLFRNYYRVGNVIINGRRWGDIGYRYSHGDLIRW